MGVIGVINFIIIWYVILVLVTDLIAMFLQLLLLVPVNKYIIPNILLAVVVTILTICLVVPKVWIVMLYTKLLTIVVNSKMLFDKYKYSEKGK